MSLATIRATQSTVKERPIRPEPTQSLVGMRAVICEDEAVTQLQLRRALARAGMDIVGVASNGREAVSTTLREHPDVVLMDIRMPVMDGIAATRQILEHYPVCVVMLTAFCDDDYRDQAQSLGVSGYIVKPITSDVLIPLISDALRKFRASRSR